ncbi:MAG: hypothetical protein BWY82_00608 [Verrucomicrobia bacterium ADurb.Bin474]|nr:MAG: hypothetical protein BWY82_00608 [Verrucomicrobia bacterium ADurb.Bin474]
MLHLLFARARYRELRGHARTLFIRFRPSPASCQQNAGALPASPDTPVCLCPALRSRPSLHAHGPRGSMTTSYCVHVGAAPPYTTRKARTIIEISGFYHAALTLAPYASCGPCGRATQCSLPSSCQPFSGGIVYPPGINVVFHFFFLFLYSVPHNQVFWRDM